MKAKFLLSPVAVAALAISSFTSAPAAEASATGFQSMGSFQVSVGGQTLTVPAGCLLGHSIRGDGRTINKQWASWTCAPPASSWLAFHKAYCNPRIDFVFRDTNNKEYYRQRGATRLGCWGSEGPTWNGTPRVAGRYGRACAHLYVNGKFISAQCHNITP